MKTFTSFKSNNQVILNLARNFSKVLIVKINADFDIRGKLIDRKALPKTKGGRRRLNRDAFELAG